MEEPSSFIPPEPPGAAPPPAPPSPPIPPIPPIPDDAPRSIPISACLIALEQMRAITGQIPPPNRLVPLYFWDILFHLAVTALSRSQSPISYSYVEAMSLALEAESFMVRGSPTQVELSLHGEQEEELSQEMSRSH